MQPARSLVMSPASMVSTQMASRLSLKVASSAFPTKSVSDSKNASETNFTLTHHRVWLCEQDLLSRRIWTLRRVEKPKYHDPNLLIAYSFSTAVYILSYWYSLSLTNGVGGCLLALLMLSVVTGNGAVGRFGFNGLPIRTDQHTSHHSKTAKPLREESIEKTYSFCPSQFSLSPSLLP